MSVSLSVKNVPDDVAEKLRKRAALNHRSLQGEVRAILQEAAEERDAPRRPLTVEEASHRIKTLGLSGEVDITSLIREVRDSR